MLQRVNTEESRWKGEENTGPSICFTHQRADQPTNMTSSRYVCPPLTGPPPSIPPVVIFVPSRRFRGRRNVVDPRVWGAVHEMFNTVCVFLWFTDNKLFQRAFKIWVKRDSCNMSDMLNLLKYKQKYLLSGSFRPQSEEQVPSYPGGCEIGLVCATVSRTVQKTTGCVSPNMVEEFRTGPV